MDQKPEKSINTSWRTRLYEIIFEADTPAGKAFDVALLWAIIFSIMVVMLESVSSIQARYGETLRSMEVFFTILFTVEYIARIIAVKFPGRYIFSLLGMVDLLALLPAYLGFFFTGTHYLLAIRTVRLLRVFRIFKLSRFLGEAEVLKNALRASRHKITVFLVTVVTIVIITGTLMYVIEGPKMGLPVYPLVSIGLL